MIAKLACLVLKVVVVKLEDQLEDERISLSTSVLERTPGDMTRDPQKVQLRILHKY
jgi:hypothetical protein